MENYLYLTSKIPPSVNHYLAYRAIMKNGKPMAVSYNTQESIKFKKEFKEYITAEVERQGWSIPVTKNQHFYIDAVFYFQRVDMDANNYWKVILDAITDAKVIWEDDNVVCERVQGVFYDSENPRMEMVIHPVEYVGIFENMSQLEKFKANCVGCSRYMRNCSILNKAISGHMQPEICDGVCVKAKMPKDAD